MIYNGNKDIYHLDFTYMPRVPQKIFEILATESSVDAENLWKVLKYQTYDALDKSNLTMVEKTKMLWKPELPNADQKNLFNVFLVPLVEDELNDSSEQTQLRFYRDITKPVDYADAKIAYQFMFTVSSKAPMVYDDEGYLVERSDLIERYLLSILNGRDIGFGSSYFSFNERAMGGGVVPSRLGINNSKSLYGRKLDMILSYNIVSKDGGGICG